MNSEKTMRNFEDEYRKYAKQSAPDLWDRIEAGIDVLAASKTGTTSKADAGTQEKTAHTADEKMTGGSNIVSIATSERYKEFDTTKAGTADDKGNTDKRTEQKERSGGGKKRINMSRYMGVIAAAACGLLVISAMGWISLSSKSNSAAEAAYAPAAPAAEAMADAAPAAEEATSEQKMEEYEEAAPMEAAEESAPMADEAAPAAAESETYAAGTDGAYAGAAESYDEAAAEAGEAEEYESDAAAEETADNTVADETEESKEAAEESYDTDGSAYAVQNNKEDLKADSKAADTDRADGLDASSKTKRSATKQSDEDKLRLKEQKLTVTLDSLKEEDGKLICTMSITDPGITKHKEGDTVTAAVNEPIKSRVSKFYGKNKASGKDRYVVTLVPLESGFLVTDIRQELK